MNQEEYGLDTMFEQEKEEKVVAIAEARPKRRMFYDWEVGGRVYKMKLNTSMICKLEEKFRQNLLNVISQDGIPALAEMLTIAQGALIPWNHKLTYSDVQRLFDTYVEEGGNQLAFYTDVIMGTMAVSGFFTETQAKELTEKLKTTEAMV